MGRIYRVATRIHGAKERRLFMGYVFISIKIISLPFNAGSRVIRYLCSSCKLEDALMQSIRSDAIAFFHLPKAL